MSARRAKVPDVHADPGTAPTSSDAARPAWGGMWGWPLVFGVSTAIGLISSLFSDGGFGDWLGWLTLGAPVAACLWWGWMRR